jgi:hypothetical protein
MVTTVMFCLKHALQMEKEKVTQNFSVRGFNVTQYEEDGK